MKMNRYLAFFLALVFASITVSSACVAGPSDLIHFSLESDRGRDKIQARFRDERRGHHQGNWSNGFTPSELIGLDVAAFQAGGSRPLRFAIVREAGRLDCSGNGGNASAAGNCAFRSDPAFIQLLASHGIAPPTLDEAFGLVAVNVRRELVEALAAVRYPTPSVDDLIALTAVGADGRYISGLANTGYRPAAIHGLVEFKALNVTPEWIGGFARMGYANLPADQLVQMRALDISPDFVAGFDRVGYRGLPVNTLVQFKAVGVTPEFAAAARQRKGSVPSVDELVRLRVLGERW
jgi:hypothetical protein